MATSSSKNSSSITTAEGEEKKEGKMSRVVKVQRAAVVAASTHPSPLLSCLLGLQPKQYDDLTYEVVVRVGKAMMEESEECIRVFELVVGGGRSWAITTSSTSSGGGGGSSKTVLLRILTRCLLEALKVRVVVVVVVVVVTVLLLSAHLHAICVIFYKKNSAGEPL